MLQIVHLVNKDIKRVIITIFYIHKKPGENWTRKVETLKDLGLKITMVKIFLKYTEWE